MSSNVAGPMAQSLPPNQAQINQANAAAAEEYKKAVRKSDLIIAVIIIIAGLIIIAIVFFLGLRERRFYNECNSNPSNYCMDFGCAGAGEHCINSAIRYNEDRTQYACSNLPTIWIDL